MAKSGGVRAWTFFKRNPEFQAAFEGRAREALVFEDAPFPLRRQIEAERRLETWGIYAWPDSFAANGPLSPFWTVAPMLDARPAPAEGDGTAALATAVGTALEGLRLPDGTLILKFERGGVAMQVRIADGAGFDPAGGSLEVPLRHACTWPGRFARAGDFWRLTGAPAPRTGRGRGAGIENF